MMRNPVQLEIMFNIIDTTEGIKADLVPLKRESDYQAAFERRVRREFTDPAGNTFKAWVAQPADIIIGKLRARDEGRSNKHPNDIYSMLIFDLSGYSDASIDFDLITKEVTRIGKDTFELWKQLVVRAKDEIGKRNN